jgi:hypothetical protein
VGTIVLEAQTVSENLTIIGQRSWHLRFLILNASEAHGKVFRLLDCIRYWHENQCENPCDKLYGLQAILDENERIEVDYDSSPTQVFLHAVAIVMATQVWGHCAADVWKLARSMGVTEWRSINKDSLKAVVALAEIKKKRNEPQKQLQQELHACLICLADLDTPAFRDWIGDRRIDEEIPEDMWIEKLDSILL